MGAGTWGNRSFKKKQSKIKLDSQIKSGSKLGSFKSGGWTKKEKKNKTERNKCYELKTYPLRIHEALIRSFDSQGAWDGYHETVISRLLWHKRIWTTDLFMNFSHRSVKYLNYMGNLSISTLLF